MSKYVSVVGVNLSMYNIYNIYNIDVILSVLFLSCCRKKEIQIWIRQKKNSEILNWNY